MLYRFAGVTVDMRPRFDLLKERAAKYLAPAADGANCEPDICIEPVECPPDADGDECAHFEYFLTGGLFYRRLLKFDGMMLHASAVGYRGKAYLFSAPSGTGKSTHTAGWLRLLGDEAFIINDDKPALRFIDGVLYACGTPFSGTSPLNEDAMLPVGGVCFLRRGADDEMRGLTPLETMPQLYAGTAKVLTREDGERMLPLLIRVAETAPLYSLRCGVGDEAVKLAVRTMAGSNI